MLVAGAKDDVISFLNCTITEVEFVATFNLMMQGEKEEVNTHFFIRIASIRITKMPDNCWTKVGTQIKIEVQFQMCTEKSQKDYFSCEYKGLIRNVRMR